MDRHDRESHSVCAIATLPSTPESPSVYHYQSHQLRCSACTALQHPPPTPPQHSPNQIHTLCKTETSSKTETKRDSPHYKRSLSPQLFHPPPTLNPNTHNSKDERPPSSEDLQTPVSQAAHCVHVFLPAAVVQAGADRGGSAVEGQDERPLP